MTRFLRRDLGAQAAPAALRSRAPLSGQPGKPSLKERGEKEKEGEEREEGEHSHFCKRQ